MHERALNRGRELISPQLTVVTLRLAILCRCERRQSKVEWCAQVAQRSKPLVRHAEREEQRR